MNDLYDLMESASLHEKTCEGCREKFTPLSDNEVYCDHCVPEDLEETNCLGISLAITGLEKVQDVKESHYLPDGLRKVILWEDGKSYEVIIKPMKS